LKNKLRRKKKKIRKKTKKLYKNESNNINFVVYY
jgi:hypothetical protein